MAASRVALKKEKDDAVVIEKIRWCRADSGRPAAQSYFFLMLIRHCRGTHGYMFRSPAKLLILGLGSLVITETKAVYRRKGAERAEDARL